MRPARDNPAQIRPALVEPESAGKDDRARNWWEDKRRKRERECLERVVAKLETEIATAEADLRNLGVQMAMPRYASDFGELSKMLNRREELVKQVARLTKEWEAAAEKLEDLDRE